MGKQGLRQVAELCYYKAHYTAQRIAQLPGYAPAFIFEGGFPGMVREMQMALRLLGKGRLPLIPARIKRIKNLRAMVARVLPLDGIE